MDFAYTFSGFVVGAIVGLTGVGGGSLMTPLLVLLFGVSPATAVGTDLLYAAITKAGGVVVHGRRDHIRWDIVGLLAAGSLPGALVTLAVLATLADRLIPLSAAFIKTAQLTWTAFIGIVTSRASSQLPPDLRRVRLAAAINAVFGLLVAWVLVRYRFPGQRFVDALVDLPFALPTAVAGIALTGLFAPTVGSERS